MNHTLKLQYTLTVHALLLGARTTIFIATMQCAASACTSSAVTFFNSRPANVPHTQPYIWHKKKLRNQLLKADLVDIKTIDPRIVVDLRYASNRNFTGKKIYRSHRCYLKKATALKLGAVQKELEPLQLGVKIWDGYRPPEAQQKFWQLVPDARYVAPPAQGSRHTRGCAVDVTLVDRKGKELEMPTAFDDFSEKAASSYATISQTAKKNRALLAQVMRKHGFIQATTEWWHFDDADWRHYPLLDVAL